MKRVSTVRAVVAIVALSVAALAGSVGPVRAQTGPSISLDRTQVNAGEPIIVTIVGFTSQQATVAVCGNLAKRGSSDCNMPQSQSERIRPNDEITLTQLFVEPPPVPCPCLVRATGTNGEFAVVSIDLVGHPVAPVVSPADGELVEVEVVAERVVAGLSDRVRAGLGAATTYAVTASVRNITTEPLTNVTVRANVGSRLDDDAARMQFDRPGPIGPGQTWSQTIEVELPAPHIGRSTWTVVASGAGPVAESQTTTESVPVLLYALGAVLLLDLIALAVRAMLRRRRRSRRQRPAGASASDVPPREPSRTYIDEQEPVGAHSS